jgi:hypothetical protein
VARGAGKGLAVASTTGIEILGVREVTRALGQIDEDAKKTLDKGVREAAKQLVDDSRGYVSTGLSGWKRWKRTKPQGFEPMQVSRGIKVSRSANRKKGTATENVVSVINSTAAGAIWETAGRQTSGHTKAGYAMIEAITKRDGPIVSMGSRKESGRTIWRAASETDLEALQLKMAKLFDEAGRVAERHFREIRGAANG